MQGYTRSIHVLDAIEFGYVPPQRKQRHLVSSQPGQMFHSWKILFRHEKSRDRFRFYVEAKWCSWFVFYLVVVETVENLANTAAALTVRGWCSLTYT